MSVCPICGAEAGKDKSGRQRKYCSPACARVGNNRIRAAKKRAGQDLRAGQRRCHDCGKPTTNYRCPTCLRAWRLKHGVPMDGDGGYGDALTVGLVGRHGWGVRNG